MGSNLDDSGKQYILRHLRIGWASLLVFLSLGIGLEALHGFKVDWYMEVANSTRREMWTLAHAHGTLISLVQIAFAATLFVLGHVTSGHKLAGRCLLAAGLLLPGGFFLGGVFFYSGDPGLGILLVPIGAILMLIGVLVVVLRLNPSDAKNTDSPPA